MHCATEYKVFCRTVHIMCTNIVITAANANLTGLYTEVDMCVHQRNSLVKIVFPDDGV